MEAYYRRSNQITLQEVSSTSLTSLTTAHNATLLKKCLLSARFLSLWLKPTRSKVDLGLTAQSRTAQLLLPKWCLLHSVGARQQSAMGHLSSPPAVLLVMVNWAVMCWAAWATTGDKNWWWKASLGPSPCRATLPLPRLVPALLTSVWGPKTLSLNMGGSQTRKCFNCV